MDWPVDFSALDVDYLVLDHSEQYTCVVEHIYPNYEIIHQWLLPEVVGI